MRPCSLDQQARDAAGEIVEVAIGPAAVVVDDRQRVRLAALEQFGGGVEAVGILQFGQVEAELRKLVRRGQAVADEAVVRHAVIPRKRESRAEVAEARRAGSPPSLGMTGWADPHSGTTAVASISTSAAGSTRRLTSTSAIAG